MDVPPQHPETDLPRPPCEPVVFGVLGVCAALGALWVTALLCFIFGTARFDCDLGPYDARDVAGVMVAGAIYSIPASLAWLLALALFRAAFDDRWLRGRTWLVAVVVGSVLAATGLGVAAAYHEPSPPDQCQPFRMD